jgi:hypothetical protein
MFLRSKYNSRVLFSITFSKCFPRVRDKTSHT